MHKSTLTSTAVAAVAALGVFGGGAAVAAGTHGTSTGSATTTNQTTQAKHGTKHTAHQQKANTHKHHAAQKHIATKKHTKVTGAEEAKVVAAIKATISGAKVTEVRKDADKAYDALVVTGKKPQWYQVSANLKTIAKGHGKDHDKAVPKAEWAKVTTAVNAKYPKAKVTNVRMDHNKSFDAFATTGGKRLVYKVSANLKTITVDKGNAGHPKK